MPSRLRLALAAALVTVARPPGALGAQETAPAPAGARAVATNTTVWLVYGADYALTRRWSLLAGAEVRRAGGLAHWEQLLVQPAVAYALAPGVRLAAGYEFQETWPYGEQAAPARFPAYHAWEQVQLAHGTGRVAWQHRYRVEQRWVDVPLDARTRDRRYTNRFRYLVRATVPLRGPTLDAGEPYAAAYDEAFVSWGRNVGRNVFDQNRLAAVLGWRLTDATRVEAGYMQQLVFKSDGVHMERNHTLLFVIAQASPLRR